MKKLQKEIFLTGEGDAWYSRNKFSMENSEKTPELRLLTKYIFDDYKILEIGCSNGAKLNYLKSHVKTKRNYFYGLDPSLSSVEDGRETFSDFDLTVGTSDSLPYEDNYFDLVILGFCLYLVDRSLVFKTVSEIDRVLKERRYLAITDFEAPTPYKNIYIHAEGVYSYKNAYHKFFDGGSHYSIADKVSFSHQSDKFDPNINERISTTILYKEAYSDVYKERY